ncbi:MAG: tetratricopeptide repeat protein [Planctomycetota bacterium]|nr:tetratricopeptide repeat protein [Planctomycetota bacterium]
MDFTKQLQKADEALHRRNWDFAVELYQQLLELSPDLGEARAGLRKALRKRYEAKAGGNKFLRALGGAAPLAMAKTLSKAGKHDAAAKQLETYLSTNPLDEEANLLLGTSLESAGHANSARAVYEFLAEIAPKSAEGLRRAGAMTRRLGDPGKALEYYERALQADPRDQEALRARKDLAAELALTGRGKTVEHSRDQIKDKDQARELDRATRMHLSDDDLRAELERLEARYADSPDSELMVRLSEVTEKLKDLDSAVAWAERALAYKKESFDLVARVGDLRAKQLKKQIAEAGKRGDQAEADRLEGELFAAEVLDWRRRVELRPADMAARLQLGRRLHKAGEIDAAMGELQKAATDPRARREAQVLLAQCFQAKGFLDLARAEYERALESSGPLDERGKEILYHLGGIAEAEGKPSDARALYARIFGVDVGYRDVAARMERLR